VSAARRSPLRLLVIAAVAVVLLVGAAGLGYLFLRGAPPPAVGVASPSAGSASADPATPGTTSPPGTIDGSWAIDPTVGAFEDFSGSFVGYRVVETLANVGANEAVGRTPDVTGSLVLDGSTVTSVDVTADLTTLQSDDSRRDGQLQRQGIETGRFPTATFTLTSPIDLGAVPVDGRVIEVTATGDLTLHGVTRSVEVPLQAVLSDDVVTVSGSIDIAFADFDVVRPNSFVVLSIEDHGVMEFQLHFRHT
jgi:polyisoprenoid-binding protein YceI